MKWVLAVALLAAVIVSCSCEIRIQSLDRQINLQSQLVKVTESIKLKNTGSKPFTTFDVCTLATLASREAVFKVTATKSKKELKVADGTSSPSAGVKCHTVSFEEPLPAGETLALQAYSVYTKVQVPLPAELQQDQQQLMVYEDNLYVVSPYQVAQQNTEVLLPSSTVMSYPKGKTSQLSGKTLKLGKFDSIKPFTIEQLRVHYESSTPFVQVLKLEKEIQVSHWGNIYVEETYELKNAGAKHTGQFSRLRYSASQFNKKDNSFRDLVAKLPHDANSLYYKDLIGNISSSNVRKTPTSTLINFELRYPLMGGWKVDFFLGWSIPLDKALYQLGWGKLQLRTNFASSIDGVQIDEYTLKVVLPEGSTYKRDSIPFAVGRNTSVKYTYLDTTGRPVLLYQKANVVPDHNIQFELDYDFNSTSLLREPLLLVAAFAAFFATVIFINRLDLTISRDDSWKEGQKQEQVDTLMASLSNAYTELLVLSEKVGKLANSTRDPSAVDSAVAEKAAQDARAKALQAQIDAQLVALRESSPKLAGQVDEVDRKAAAVKDKAAAQLDLKLQLLKKGASASDINKKMLDSASAQQQLVKDLQAALDRLFGQY